MLRHRSYNFRQRTMNLTPPWFPAPLSSRLRSKSTFWSTTHAHRGAPGRHTTVISHMQDSFRPMLNPGQQNMDVYPTSLKGNTTGFPHGVLGTLQAWSKCGACIPRDRYQPGAGFRTAPSVTMQSILPPEHEYHLRDDCRTGPCILGSLARPESPGCFLRAFTCPMASIATNIYFF